MGLADGGAVGAVQRRPRGPPLFDPERKQARPVQVELQLHRLFEHEVVRVLQATRARVESPVNGGGRSPGTQKPGIGRPDSASRISV